MENLPFISAKCITYGRVAMLEESVESFLKQNYPADKCELIIVNDYPLQKLHYNHPQVKIINLDKTFDTIGEKENFALSQCSGELIAVWDDDDVALPNHLSNIAKYFTEGGELLFWGNGALVNSNNIQLTGLGNSGIVYTKKVWEELGGHPLENAGYDSTFVNQIIYREGAKPMIVAYPPNEEVSWFYMWGGRGYHMSGEGTDHAGKLNVIQRHSSYIE